jgi:catechol 2,3-dioxygenase-like lactoylglutathione lyase family enzyme
MSIQLKRIGHVGILVADIERSLRFYTEVLGCKITNRNKRADGSETVFLRFDDVHHDFVIASAPPGVDVTAASQRERLVQQIAFEVEDRDAFLQALAHLQSKGVKPIILFPGSRWQSPGDFHGYDAGAQRRGIPPQRVRCGPAGVCTRQQLTSACGDTWPFWCPAASRLAREAAAFGRPASPAPTVMSL